MKTEGSKPKCSVTCIYLYSSELLGRNLLPVAVVPRYQTSVTFCKESSKVKLQFTLLPATKTQGKVQLCSFFNHCAIRQHVVNPLNAELNPICHLLALLGARHILHVSRIRVKATDRPLYPWNDPVPIVLEAGWAHALFRLVLEVSPPTGI